MGVYKLQSWQRNIPYAKGSMFQTNVFILEDSKSWEKLYSKLSGPLLDVGSNPPAGKGRG